jgi:hypothetical protein
MMIKSGTCANSKAQEKKKRERLVTAVTDAMYSDESHLYLLTSPIVISMACLLLVIAIIRHRMESSTLQQPMRETLQ